MIDRFKFRVWDKKSNIFIERGSIDINLGVFSTSNLLDETRFLIEQCTGLKDKNGRLIYEGDIVRRYVGLGKHGSQKTEDIDVVKWYINGYVLENYCDYFADTDDFEVIGNIHENGDLL